MKALVLEQYNQLIYRDVREPEIGSDEVLVRVKACGICGSDVHGLDGSTGRRIPPLVMGHEAAGIIADVSSDVSEWHVGDLVTFDSTIYCGECYFCRHGRVNLCENRRVLGVSCGEYRQNGAFAEYVAIPQRILYPLPDGISFDQAAMVEALSIAFHAVGRASPRLNDTAVVVGVGMIGLLVVQSLRLSGCGRIFAVDIDGDRLDMACRMGADRGLCSDSADVVQWVAEHTCGRGADLAIEAVGFESTINTAIQCTRKGGTVTLIGNLQPRAEFPSQEVVTRELDLRGSCASSGEYPACLDMLDRGAVCVDDLISATAPLEDGAAWFKRLYDKEPGLMKVILHP